MSNRQRLACARAEPVAVQRRPAIVLGRTRWSRWHLRAGERNG